MSSCQTIPFIQYVRPLGQTIAVQFHCGNEAVVAKAMRIIEAGYRFECEHLIDDWVSFAISDGEEDVEMALCPNGIEVLSALEGMINRFELED